MPQRKQSFSSGPDVTAVVAAYNVEALLPSAVQSLTSQTLRSLEILIVDDCSTDGTPDVARALEAGDSRVRYLRLDRNSGGVGGPRNRGIAEAQAPFVVFLDADDVLERHAVKNMLLAAEREKAVVVAGRTERVDMESGATSGWYRHLYANTRVLDSIGDYPELIHDTTATNKLYSTDFLREEGLGFAEGLNYEDVLFTGQLYAAIGRMVVLPEVVYEWRSYPSDLRTTITNRRGDFSNLRDRVAVLNRVNEIYAPLGEEVHREFARKLLRHHARLYLNDTLGMADGDAAVVFDEFRPLLESLTIGDFDFLFPYERFMYASALDGDRDGVRNAILAERDGLTTGTFVPGPDGRLQWSLGAAREPGRESASGGARDSLVALDDERLVRRPHRLTRYLHQATSADITRSGIALTGFTNDPFGQLVESVTAVTASLRLLNGQELARVPVEWSVKDGKLLWSLIINAPRRKTLREKARRTLEINLTVDGGGTSSATIVLPNHGIPPIPDRSLVGRVLEDRWSTTDSAFPPAVFGIRHGHRGRKLIRLGRRYGSSAAARGRRAARRLRRFRLQLARLASPRGPIGLRVYSLMRLLPLRRHTVVFESHMGRSRSDSPGAVARELTARRPDLKVIWVTEAGARGSAGSAGGTVRRDSWGYLHVLARSGYIVDNQSLPEFFRKRPGQRYLQTWHGIPLKKMGLDEPDHTMEPARSRLLSASAQWDGLVVPNPYFERTFVPAFGYEGELIRYGTPRCDALINGDHDPVKVKAHLGIKPECRVVLYAPTFREAVRDRSRPAPINIDLLEWREALPHDVILLIRSHYLNRFDVPERARGFCIDCSAVDDLNELYAVTDLLVTDYSSVMFDFAVTGRPIVIYAPDWQEYVHQNRGAYFDLREQGPGTFAETQGELVAAVRQRLAEGAPPAQEEFRKAFAGREDGRASARAVDFLLGGPV